MTLLYEKLFFSVSNSILPSLREGKEKYYFYGVFEQTWYFLPSKWYPKNILNPDWHSGDLLEAHQAYHKGILLYHKELFLLEGGSLATELQRQLTSTPPALILVYCSL